MMYVFNSTKLLLTQLYIFSEISYFIGMDKAKVVITAME